MARPLIFQFGEQEIAGSLNKIDRSKLYGYKEVEALDDQGQRCDLATLADDGQTLVGKGSTALGWLDGQGQWRQKTELKPVDQQGKEIQPVASSYDAPIKLDETATIDEFLQHDIRLIYALESETDLTSLKEKLSSGTIYRFSYSYRGGLDADAGFLLNNETGDVIVAIGNPTNIQFIGLTTQSVESEEEVQIEDIDSMDFDMI
jgi:hypothetical protein